MGFLDMFDNPNILASILGSGGVTPGPPPTPPAAAPAGPPSFPPVQDLNTAPSGTVMQGGFPVPQGFDAGQSGTAMQGGFPAAQGFDNSVPMPPNPQGTNIPLPRPRPDMAMPPNATPTVGQQPVGPPMSLAPPSGPPMPPPSQFNSGGQPMTSATGGGLAGALGISNPDLRAALAGAGRGLSAVGQMRPGATAGASFAAGAGGALQGTEAARNQQEQQQRAKQNDLFNQSSTAFKDMLAARGADNTEAYRQAQSKYLLARAQSLMTGGSGSNAWQNTPYGKVIQVENEAQKYEKGQQILLQKRWTMNGATPDQQQKDLDQLGKNVDAYRKRLYGQAGVDPDKAAKIRDMGTSQENPFDTKGMTLDQFHQQVPMGAWYKDQNGVVRQRTVPPPGSSAPGQQSSATDDYIAMQPAA